MALSGDADRWRIAFCDYGRSGQGFETEIAERKKAARARRMKNFRWPKNHLLDSILLAFFAYGVF